MSNDLTKAEQIRGTELLHFFHFY